MTSLWKLHTLKGIFYTFKNPWRYPHETHVPTHPPLSVHRPPLPPHWHETLPTFTQCTGGAGACSMCMCEGKLPCRSSLHSPWFSFGSRSPALDQNSPPVFAISVSSPWGMADGMCHHTRCFFGSVWVCILILRSLGHGRSVCLRVHGEKLTRTTWV